MKSAKPPPPKIVRNYRLRARLYDLNMGMARLAKRMKVDKSTVIRWLTGERCPSFPVLEQMMVVLEVSRPEEIGYRVVNQPRVLVIPEKGIE